MRIATIVSAPAQFSGRALLAALMTVASVAACTPVDSEPGDMAGTDEMDSAAPAESYRMVPPSKQSPGHTAGCGDTERDPQNCGACGNSCLATQACEKGACADQLTDCSIEGSCVDPTCTEQGRYSVDELVAADLQNGRRLWQRDYAANLTYGQATEYCATLTIRGITGWRLPNGEESRSIVYRSAGLKGCGAPQFCAPAIDQAVFPETASDLYWTTEVYDSGMHLCRNFCDGRSTPYPEDNDSPHYVRCVHDPLPSTEPLAQ